MNIKSTRLALSFILFFSCIATGGISAHLEKDRPNACYIGFGYDYALFTLELGYARGVELPKCERQLVLNADLTLPMLNPDIYDWRARVGAAVTTVKLWKFRAPVHVDAIFRSGKNSSYRAMGFGTALSFLPGIYLRTFSAGVELTWDQQWATHIEHTEEYRQLVFSDANDGWYGTTAFIFRYGANVGTLVMDRIEILLHGGYEQDGKYDYRTPPFYGILHANIRF